MKLCCPTWLGRAFKELASKSADAAPSLPVMQYDWRRSESVFVVPQRDRVVVIFSLDFNDDTDQAMARVFLQVRHRAAHESHIGSQDRVCFL